MRALAAIGVVLIVAAGTGCFLGEIDASMDAYEGRSGKPPPAAAPATAKPAAATRPAASPAPSGAGAGTAPGPSWWQQARTLGSEPVDDTIAGCRLGGRTEFMRRDDCLARGGTTP